MTSDLHRSHDNGGAAPNEERRRRIHAIHPAARLVAVPVIALVLIHTLLLALWAAPTTPAQEEFGSDRLRNYVMPWFDQNWSIFAPTPKRVATSFEVRAFFEDDQGNSHTSEWTNMAQLENETVLGNPFVSRSSMISRRLADHIHSARSNMNDEQLDWLAANYFVTSVDELRDELLAVDGGASAGQVDRYLQADEAARFLATAVAKRDEAADVIRVQFRTSTQRVPAWENRFEESLNDQEKSYREYGWRAPAEVSEDQLKYFDAYFDRLNMDEVGEP